MQYVRNLSDSVSTAWNSLNPATLSGAIDVIVVEQEDGTLACSPFHVRFGKFSLLRPHEKKVEFRVNGAKQSFPMKLGEGGEAFFVFETTDTIPLSLQTSPVVSAASSPSLSYQGSVPELQEPDTLDLNDAIGKPRSVSLHRPLPTPLATDSAALFAARSTSPEFASPHRPHSEALVRKIVVGASSTDGTREDEPDSPRYSDRPPTPASTAPEVLQRARALAEKLKAIEIPSHINETGDLMLDMSAFKNNDEDAFRVEILARRALIEELDGNYDIGALIGLDEEGNIWIYSSEKAKKEAMAAMKRDVVMGLSGGGLRSASLAIDAASDPGYHSDGSDQMATSMAPMHRRSGSDVGQMPLQTPESPGATVGDPNRNYAKTLRLTSDQLKSLQLQAGENSMSFTVNRATCSASMYLWQHATPVVISDIDGTITKSDALGHVLNMIGRDWTHAGVAKLYSDIAANGYNIMYLTSRSVGLADRTREYVFSIQQDGYKLPRGPCILSPDRTMAALRREVILRKPEVFKMSTLRDIRNLYGPDHSPFYAGFGNRFTDQISYRTVHVPRNRIFTINSNAEVLLDLLSLNKLKLSYVNITEVVDHYFPPVSTLVKGGGEEYTDFRFWRDTPLDVDDFSASESEDENDDGELESQYAEEDDEDVGDGLGDSFVSRDSIDDGDTVVYENGEQITASFMEDADADDEEEDEDDDDDDDDDDVDNEMENEAHQAGMVPIVESPDAPKSETPPQASPTRAVQDVNAELITGMKNLSVEEQVQKIVQPSMLVAGPGKQTRGT